ncbi:MAG: hypothetical protein NZ561_11020 [Phycisphaerae bacterium]|nr:hypothetical protein [Phycisphaerae bacterium]MDW8261554.1 hypothetical protein [Phycisphaerales bacterium]
MRLRFPKLGSRLSRRLARRWQQKFEPGPPAAGNPRVLPVHVLTLAGKPNVAEVVLMWRSLARAAGRPARFLVAGDGTLDADDARLLQEACPGAEVIEWCDIVAGDVRRAIGPYANQHPLGKKLAVLMSLRPHEPTLFTDADVLYFDRSSSLAQGFGDAPGFLIDCERSLDERLLDDQTTAPPVNSGVLLLTRPLDWSLALERYARVRDDPRRFTEQTMVHLAVHASGGRALDPALHIVTVEDQFRWKDVCDPRAAVLRHYVGPVRHKMWNMAHRLGLDRPEPRP